MPDFRWFAVNCGKIITPEVLLKFFLLLEYTLQFVFSTEWESSTSRMRDVQGALRALIWRAEHLQLTLTLMGLNSVEYLTGSDPPRASTVI